MSFLRIATCFLSLFLGLYSSGLADFTPNKKTVEGRLMEIRPDAVGVIDQLSGHEISIAVDQDTRFQGVDQTAELKESDKVKVHFKEKDHKKTAVLIIKEPWNGGPPEV